MYGMRILLSTLAAALVACSGGLDEPVPSGKTGGGTTPTPDPEPSGETGREEGWLKADGKDVATYSLITACGYNYETPDKSGAHASAPFRHITQSYDTQLKSNVFNFILHIENDDDRGKTDVTDRQRNEIKTDSGSPASMVALKAGETLVIKWKFRLPAGMKTTTSFSHVHQLKGIDNSAGTADVSQPLVTFTARTVSGGQEFQIIYNAPHSTQADYLFKCNLADFLGQWVSVEETVKCDTEGSYSVVIRRCSDGKVLATLTDVKRNLWRDGTTGIRPKWGLYRSFGEKRSNASQLRDETLQFADFYVGHK